MPDKEMPPGGQEGGALMPANDAPMPPAATLQPATTQMPARMPPQPLVRTVPRNPIFAEMVRGDEDLPGLIGYALYKQNKRDWLASFFKIHGRDPSEVEVESYTVGERTQRRLDTYRKLAADMIDKAAPSIPAAAPAASQPPSEAGRVVPARIPALKEAATRGAPATRASVSTRSRGATVTLLFWILVLIALGIFGYWYVNSPSFNH